jgi:hypothetical protein
MNVSFRFGIQTGDIFRSVSDNTNAAVLAGKMVASHRVGEGGTVKCMMHSVDLTAKHALLIAKRMKNGRPVDFWNGGVQLRVKFSNLMVWWSDGRSKRRMGILNEISNKTFQKDCMKLEVPNQTRVLGFHNMLVSGLQSKHLLTIAYEHKDDKRLNGLTVHKIEQEEWQTLAEWEAILGTIMVLSKNAQADNPCQLALLRYEISYTRKKLFSADATFSVMDVSKNWQPSDLVKDIPRINIKVDGLTELGQQLINRLKAEYDKYLADIDGDEKMAILIHPIAYRFSLR